MFVLLVQGGWWCSEWSPLCFEFTKVSHILAVERERKRKTATFKYLKIDLKIISKYDSTHYTSCICSCYCDIGLMKIIHSCYSYSLPLWQSCLCTGTQHILFCLWLNFSLQSGIRENVLQFPRIQMANCTRPPALNDKWQKSTFHPSPSLPLGCTLIFLLKVWWKAQLDVWMWAALERIWYRIILFNSYSA